MWDQEYISVLCIILFLFSVSIKFAVDGLVNPVVLSEITSCYVN